MILVFFIVLITFILFFMEFKINVERIKLYIGEDKINNKNIFYVSDIFFEIYIFKALRIIRVKLNNSNVKNSMSGFSISDKKIINDFIKKNLKNINALNIQVDVETSNYLLTSKIIAFISTVISVFYSKYLFVSNKSKYKFDVNSKFVSKNMINVELNSIIRLNIVHIIPIIIFLIKRKRVDKNERTSNRRSYDYSYE